MYSKFCFALFEPHFRLLSPESEEFENDIVFNHGPKIVLDSLKFTKCSNLMIINRLIFGIYSKLLINFKNIIVQSYLADGLIIAVSHVLDVPIVIRNE